MTIEIYRCLKIPHIYMISLVISTRIHIDTCYYYLFSPPPDGMVRRRQTSAVVA